MAETKQDWLRRIPPITELLKNPTVQGWLKEHPVSLVTDALRAGTTAVRQRLFEASDKPSTSDAAAAALSAAEKILREAAAPRIRHAINATGIILHTGLGRAVFPSAVIDALQPELKGCCTMAVDPETGERAERDELIEPLLCELTGAEAATVVNNNAAATLLVLSCVAQGREVIVSRGQLIEIGGSFRLPEVMAQSGAILREIGATNRTHLRDYSRAICERTAAILRVHPSNYRIIGFTAQPELSELAGLAKEHKLPLIDDIGAGALLGLEQFGMAHEPTVPESIKAGADLVLFSGDKLIGASQAGIIVGRADLIHKIRKHPLMRALRIDKTCAMILERTLRLFRDPKALAAIHPTYAMMSESPAAVRKRAERLAAALAAQAPAVSAEVVESQAFLGSGSLPGEAIQSAAVAISHRAVSASELARRLRTSEPCVFGRIEQDRVYLDSRTLRDGDVPVIARVMCAVLTEKVAALSNAS